MKKHIIRKLAALVTTVLFLTACASAKSNNLIVSKVEYAGTCSPLIPPGPADEASAESITSALVLIAGEALVNVGVSFVANWLTDFEDSYKGSDTALNVQAFYCKVGDYPGVMDTIKYTRSTVSGKNSTPMITLESKLEFFVGEKKSEDGAITGLFTITPTKLDYKDNIAKRGATKDLTVTYSFEFFDSKGNSTKIAVEPFVFKSVESGKKYENLDMHMGSKLVGAIPTNFKTVKNGTTESYSGPFKLKVELAETSVGKGEELAGKIAKAIGESIKEDKGSLAEMILDDWLNLKKEEKAGKGGNGS